MPGRLKGSVIIITGAANGIGITYAEALAGEGARVAVTDVDLQGAGRVAQKIRQTGGEAVELRMDISDEPSVRACVRSVIESFGRLDVLINNAALSDTTLGKKSFVDIPVDEWDRMMAVNVRGPWLAVKAAYPQMKSQGHGKIINVTSTLALRGGPGILHYASSKSAVIGLTRTLAAELGEHNITVNAIAPGLTVTERTARVYTDENFAMGASRRCLKRNQFPTDLVGAIVFLSSHESDFITGQTLLVNGGDLFN